MKYEACRHCNGTGKQISQAALGIELRRSRENRGVSLRAMAIALNISAAYLSDLELGRRQWNDRVTQYREALKNKTRPAT